MQTIGSKDIARITEEWAKITLQKYGRIPGLEEYTGTGKSLGETEYFGSAIVGRQFLFLLARKNVDPSGCQSFSYEGISKHLKDLKKKKILEGIKVLDLGCGIVPAFARCARSFGAEAYTADFLPADSFFQREEYALQNRLEPHFHISADLKKPSTLDSILLKANGPLDVVSSAKLEGEMSGTYGKIDAPKDVESIAIPLLAPKGHFFHADTNRIVTKYLH